MIKTIRTREEVWAELQRLRVALGLRSMEQVLQHLLATLKQTQGAAKPSQPDPLLMLVGLGKKTWKGVEPDDYVESLREGW